MVGLFREARTRSRAALAGWTVVQSAVLWGVALVVLPLVLLRVEEAWGIARFLFPGQVPLAAALFLVCSVLNASAGAAMVRWARRPYAYVRNPMALFGIGQGLAVGLGLGSWLMLTVSIATGIGWHVVVRPPEEADLARRLGAEYDAYRREVRCWLPRLTPYRPPPTGRR